MHTLPDLPYKFEALEPYIDRLTMQIHHDKHHGAYVENLNKVLEPYPDLAGLEVEKLLTKLDKVPEEIRTKVRNNAGGHLNHSMFWKMMRPATGEAGTVPTGNLIASINSNFGSFTNFQEKFLEAALSRFGSGWVWLIGDKKGLSIVDTPNQDTPVMEKKDVILGLDVWEHAYYLTYQNRRADYIKAWWNIVNWPEVLKRFEEARG